MFIETYLLYLNYKSLKITVYHKATLFYYLGDIVHVTVNITCRYAKFFNELYFSAMRMGPKLYPVSSLSVHFRIGYKVKNGTQQNTREYFQLFRTISNGLFIKITKS